MLFCLTGYPLYQRIGGEAAIQAIAEAVTRKLLLDEQLSPLMNEINPKKLLDKQKHFLKTVLGAYWEKQDLPENLREFYRQQSNSRINDGLVNDIFR